MAEWAPGGSGGATCHTLAHSRVLGQHNLLLSNPKVRPGWEARSLRSRPSANTYLR
ncbi:MAG TPA: hypothetical protein VMI55_02555 [Thermoplasmata archaeon]|nr:hypothetical protein [Thermoplasmata archaeon]